ncbi:MAG: peptide-N-glycosidase [Candidatus Marinimicrobia bacterium]|nr:peptide-N-glycosidase [Candidatus Neomarinimicrobiota bacterium]
MKTLNSLFLSVIMMMVVSNLSGESPSGEVVYGTIYNGKEMENRDFSILIKNEIVAIKQKRGDSKESLFIDLENKETISLLTLDNGNQFLKKSTFDSLDKPILSDETAVLLGYNCKKAVFDIRSNKIEVYYTEETPLAGSPSLSFGAGLGLVLKVIRNGNFITYAKEIKSRQVSDTELGYNIENARVVDEQTYYRKIIDSRYLTLPVFHHESINFGRDINNPAGDQVNTTYRYSNGTVILKKLPAQNFDRPMMVFAELCTWSEGDAYDRTGSMFIIPVQKEKSFLDALKNGKEVLPVYKDSQGEEYQGMIATEAYDPPLELMRFFTPFGVRHFNKNVKIDGYVWEDSAKYKMDISDFAHLFNEEVWIGMFIGNYVKDGHGVNLDLHFYPGYNETKKEKWIQPLFNTLNIMEMSGQNYGKMFQKNDSLTVEFLVPEGVKHITLRYNSTGHGGWGGGDEFNPKRNEIFIDGKMVFWYIPWREDCATYRFLNPASGNFENGLSSSDLSRSAWCPGTVTQPMIVPLPDLKAGKHMIKIAIPMGEPEGGSFSHWAVSGVLLGEKE